MLTSSTAAIVRLVTLFEGCHVLLNRGGRKPEVRHISCLACCKNPTAKNLLNKVFAQRMAKKRQICWFFPAVGHLTINVQACARCVYLTVREEPYNLDHRFGIKAAIA